MPLMREVMVGFFGFSETSPFGCGVPWVGGGSAKLPSGCECNEEVVEIEGAGEATGLELALGGLLPSLSLAEDDIVFVITVTYMKSRK